TAMPGGPAIILVEILLNKDAFTGKAIVKPTDTADEAAGKITDYLWKSLMPNLPLPYAGTFAADAIEDAVRGKTDTLGREVSLPQALARGFGINVRTHAPDEQRRSALLEARRKLYEVDDNIRSAVRRGARNDLTAAEVQRTIESEGAKRRQVQEAYRRRIGAGLPAD
ncbi:MAG: hypothetical protein ACT4P4_25760, partial [Betaproteobacteria bacterium]